MSDDKVKIRVPRLGKTHFIAVVLIAVVAGVFFMASQNPVKLSPHDAFAQCLTEKGATFYGAWWCPHCAEQKELFGDAIRHVNYMECSTQDRRQTQACTDADIRSYPTWEFADGTRQSGVLALETLSEKTECALP